MKDMRFARNFTKLDGPDFSTVRPRGKFEVDDDVRVTRPDHGPRTGKVTFVFPRVLDEIPAEFLARDTDTNTKDEAIAVLRGFYPSLNTSEIWDIVRLWGSIHHKFRDKGEHMKIIRKSTEQVDSIVYGEVFITNFNGFPAKSKIIDAIMSTMKRNDLLNIKANPGRLNYCQEDFRVFFLLITEQSTFLCKDVLNDGGSISLFSEIERGGIIKEYESAINTLNNTVKKLLKG
jgi:hypothetical protein